MSQPRVRAVWFQSSVTAPGIQGIDTRINEETARTLKLTYSAADGLWIEKGSLLTHVPSTNIKNVLFYARVEDEVVDESNTKTRLK